jgi:CheY-like chemotaxis protein/HPt (histidine-containing phosphotransfer) domain-containing protein
MDQELLEAFQAEAVDHLHALEQELMDAERARSDPDSAKRMFISAHTVKGGAAMLGMHEAQALAAAMEQVLGRYRDAHSFPEGETTLLLLQGCGILRGLVMDTEVGERGSLARNLANKLLSQIGEPEVAPPTAPVVGEREATVSSTVLRPRVWRALVVDQAPAARMVAGMVLRDVGFEVDALADGDEALRRLATGGYDLLVAGVKTRSLSALDLIKAVRRGANGGGIPVVVIGEASPRLRQAAATLDVADWIPAGADGQQQMRSAARHVQQRGEQR